MFEPRQGDSMKLWGLSKLYGRLSDAMVVHLALDTPETPNYQRVSNNRIRQLWRSQGPEGQDEALKGLEAAYAYRDRSNSNTLVMKGLIFTGFFALLAFQTTVGLTTLHTPLMIASPLFMTGSLYTIAGEWCLTMAFRPTHDQLNPKHKKDERLVKLREGKLAQYFEVGGREAAQRASLQRQRVWLERSIRHLGRSLALTAVGIVTQTVVIIIMMIVYVVQFFIWLF